MFSLSESVSLTTAQPTSYHMTALRTIFFHFSQGT